MNKQDAKFKIWELNFKNTLRGDWGKKTHTKVKAALDPRGEFSGLLVFHPLYTFLHFPPLKYVPFAPFLLTVNGIQALRKQVKHYRKHKAPL